MHGEQTLQRQAKQALQFEAEKMMGIEAHMKMKDAAAVLRFEVAKLKGNETQLQEQPFEWHWIHVKQILQEKVKKILQFQAGKKPQACRHAGRQTRRQAGRHARTQLTLRSYAATHAHTHSVSTRLVNYSTNDRTHVLLQGDLMTHRQM